MSNQTIQEVAKALRTRLGHQLQSIHLFGSFVRDPADAGDIDLALTVSDISFDECKVVVASCLAEYPLWISPIDTKYFPPPPFPIPPSPPPKLNGKPLHITICASSTFEESDMARLGIGRAI